ncbi:MAG: luciferase [uncultured Rubrobacteraceae bacterium]|uniref:Luciferase n=1 Tax=uncultured Rubrobacteraceae bacterium TaxID=349277 RepID=A0A6J4QCS6_9ACTN|nr:MAG: luciferase [uncultured Rubrobacteraceae bacterium]
MRFALNVPNFGEYGDARLLAELAREAEGSGWDGFFLWDHIAWEGAERYADPWISLAAIAVATSSIRIGPMVTPLPRRRPWKVAHEAATLDRLSGGRLIFGAGLGGREREFGFFGEEPDAKRRAAMLDEGLEILTKMWSGEPFTYRGTHYGITEARLTPPPAQRPRIPVWIAGTWPRKKPFLRALRWDGYAPVGKAGSPITPRDVREMSDSASEQRGRDEPFDIRITGSTNGESPDEVRRKVAPFAEAGATWWDENLPPSGMSFGEARERVRLGPPDVG